MRTTATTKTSSAAERIFDFFDKINFFMVILYWQEGAKMTLRDKIRGMAEYLL